MTNLLFPRGRGRRDAKKDALQRVSVTPFSLRSESGVVLVMVLVLSAVSLMLITALLYLITVGTQTSGSQKRYRTALEAGVAGSDIVKQIIDARGDNTFLGGLAGINAAQNGSLAACTGTAYSSGAPTTVTGAAAKILASTPTWTTSCGLTSLTTGSTDYDFTFKLGDNPTFNVYAKIVDTREGNSLSTGTGGVGGHKLVKEAVVGGLNGGGGGGGAGEIATMSIPYLYTFEVVCENTTNLNEQVRFSVLYQF